MKKTIPILLALLLLASCGRGSESGFSPEPGRSRPLTVVLPATSEPAAGFDPAFGWGVGEHVHEPLIQSTLTVTNPDLTIGYDLATAMEVSGDGLTWTVDIREGVKFTDGEPLTAQDVAFTYNTVKNTSSVNDFTMLDRAEAVNDYTVVFHMARPFSIWPYTMAVVGILPEHAYDPANYGSNPIGSGRYMLKRWDRGQQAILESNPDYYGPQPRIEQVSILFMEEDAAFLAVQAGQADLAYTSAPYAGQAVDGFSLLSVRTVDNRGVNLPVTMSSPTMELPVRQAINMGIDRQRMIDHVLNGHGTPAYSVCDGMPWYSPVNEVEYDPEGAKALLDEWGWPAGPDGIRVRGASGMKLSLTIYYIVGDSVRQGLAAELANQLRELGIQADLKGVGWDTAYDDALFNPLVWGWGAHTPMELYNIYHTDPELGTARYSPYSCEMTDSLLDAALACTDLEESYSLWRQAQEEIAGDVPWVWLVNVDHLYWVRDGLRVAEQKIHPHGHGWSIVNNVDRWEWGA
ncbi:MAG: ABC transporter substrate-binding protein [Lawsonibacter sp.]|jgi:peptide/nickel transport system substrate-binding protein|nr:ABC transporter substrate-binding protein [Lawsonibacter sp.]